MFKEFSGALPHQKFDENLQKNAVKLITRSLKQLIIVENVLTVYN